MLDAEGCAALIEYMLSTGEPVARGEAVRELAAVVGEHLDDLHRRGLREASQEVDAASFGLMLVDAQEYPACGAIDQALTLVSLGKRHLSEQLTLQCFARSHGLTAAEIRVLESLCAGGDPNGIAALHAVSINTVRTQISSIRHKTDAADIPALLRFVARLPPMVPALRGAFVGLDGANDAMRLSA